MGRVKTNISSSPLTRLCKKPTSVIPAKETVQQTPAHQPTIEHFESCTGKKGFLLKAGGEQEPSKIVKQARVFRFHFQLSIYLSIINYYSLKPSCAFQQDAVAIIAGFTFAVQVQAKWRTRFPAQAQTIVVAVAHADFAVGGQ